MRTLAEIWGRGVETLITDHLQDSVHCKMVINLTNSLTTLVGHQVREISDRSLFQKLLTNLTYEGVRILKAAGYHESKLGGMPSWLILQVGALLPRAISRPLFEKNIKKMVLSSMAQDILQRRGTESELETINGYLLNLAEVFDVPVPYNRAIYELCKREFAKPDFQPLDVRDVWAEVGKRLAEHSLDK